MLRLSIIIQLSINYKIKPLFFMFLFKNFCLDVLFFCFEFYVGFETIRFADISSLAQEQGC